MTSRGPALAAWPEQQAATAATAEAAAESHGGGYLVETPVACTPRCNPQQQRDDTTARECADVAPHCACLPLLQGVRALKEHLQQVVQSALPACLHPVLPPRAHMLCLLRLLNARTAQRSSASLWLEGLAQLPVVLHTVVLKKNQRSGLMAFR